MIASFAAACEVSAPSSSTTSTTSTSSAGGTGGGGGGPPVLTIVHGATAAPAKEPTRTTTPLSGYATAMAANGSILTVGTTTSVYGVTPNAVTLLSIVGDEPALPAETGAIHAMTALDDGVLVAADNALFFTKGSALQLSMANDALHPLGITAMASRVADDDGDGVKETHLVLRTANAAYEISGIDLIKWTVTGEEGAPTAALCTKATVYLAFGSRVYEIDKETKKAYPLVFDVGHVAEIACGTVACDAGSPIYFASDRGLVERSAAGEYTLYTLAAEGAPAVPVEAFALDGAKTRLYALAGPQVLRVRVGEPPVAEATVTAPALPRHLVVDKVGDAWLGEGQSMIQLALGTPLSFAADVKPILHAYCSDCHATATNGAPKIDFESYDATVKLSDTVVKRVTEGTMPPITYAKKLPKETVQLLVEWSATKAP
jgi:cytochrome c5